MYTRVQAPATAATAQRHSQPYYRRGYVPPPAHGRLPVSHHHIHHIHHDTRHNTYPAPTIPNHHTLHTTASPDTRGRSPHVTMGGFDFSNHNRNAALHAQGVPLPKATSTGTTIVGCLFNGGVVIAADTRATSGPIVADKVRSARARRRLLLTPHHRTARSCTTLPPRFGAPARVPLPIPSSPRPSSQATLSCTPCRRAASPASSPA